nr:hypothetical protein [Tanacetum cinerariifolium]
MQPVAPPSPDYVSGPEHPPSPGYPLPTDASLIVASLNHVPYFDPEEDPVDNPEDDQADYPTNEGDGNDEPFDDDDDDDTDEKDPEEEPFKEDDEEGEEHPASVDSLAVPIVDLVLSARETEALEADEPTHAPGSPISILLSQTRLRRARKSVRPEPPMLASMKACISRYAALLSPPLLVPSLPLPLPSPLTTSPTDTGAPLCYKATGIRMRALLPSTSCRIDIPERPTKSNLRRCRVEQAGYGITDTWDEIVDKMIEIALNTLKGVNERVTELDTTIRDRPDHHRTTMLMDREAMYSHEAWAFFMDRSSTIAAHVKTLDTQNMMRTGAGIVITAMIHEQAGEDKWLLHENALIRIS